MSFFSILKQDLGLRVLNSIAEEILIIELAQFIGEFTRQIDLSNNAKGIYLLESKTNDGIINKKLVKQ